MHRVESDSLPLDEGVRLAREQAHGGVDAFVGDFVVAAVSVYVDGGNLAPERRGQGIAYLFMVNGAANGGDAVTGYNG